MCGLNGYVGENRLVKRKWLHRLKYGTFGKGRKIHLLLKYLVTNSVGKNYEIIVFVYLSAPEMFPEFGVYFA